MQPQEYYQEILNGITDDLERRVFDQLSQHLGEAVLRTELIEALYGERVESGELASHPHDRAIRKCVEALQTKGFPIVSSSSEAGYCLTDDGEAIDKCVREYRSRIQRMQEKVDHLLRAKSMAHTLRQWHRGSEIPVQARMF